MKGAWALLLLIGACLQGCGGTGYEPQTPLASCQNLIDGVWFGPLEGANLRLELHFLGVVCTDADLHEGRNNLVDGTWTWQSFSALKAWGPFWYYSSASHADSISLDFWPDHTGCNVGGHSLGLEGRVGPPGTIVGIIDGGWRELGPEGCGDTVVAFSRVPVTLTRR